MVPIKPILCDKSICVNNCVNKYCRWLQTVNCVPTIANVNAMCHCCAYLITSWCLSIQYHQYENLGNNKTKYIQYFNSVYGQYKKTVNHPFSEVKVQKDNFMINEKLMCILSVSNKILASLGALADIRKSRNSYLLPYCLQKRKKDDRQLTWPRAPTTTLSLPSPPLTPSPFFPSYDLPLLSTNPHLHPYAIHSNQTWGYWPTYTHWSVSTF